ncbi:hypothetical protein HDU87_002150 [Geranomyces variabilis]|uniref:Uncharacterized protein n=1 Tax=Geranomyces variabilis TaxID=109894 RepID=A0AAD5TM68_9FUNG|nr:hypothetical protein HDU87_002150 [Geranomyces variabilis]
MAVTILDISFHHAHKHFESTTRLVGYLYVLIFLSLFPLTIVQSALEVELERKNTEPERKQLRDNANAVNAIFDEVERMRAAQGGKRPLKILAVGKKPLPIPANRHDEADTSSRH